MLGLFDVSNYKEAFVSPAAFKNNIFSAAAYDRKGALVEKSTRFLAESNLLKNESPKKINTNQPTDFHAGNWLYINPFTNHYGHWLCETLSRFYPLVNKDFKIDGIVSPLLMLDSQRGKFNSPKLFNPMYETLKIFGLEGKPFITLSDERGDNLHRFENLIIPSSKFKLNERAWPEMAKLYNHISESVGGYSNRGQNLYMSRRYAPPEYYGGTLVTYNEELDDIFDGLGFDVVHSPEKISWDKQVAMYKNAKVIAGIESSALHNSAFMNRKKVIALCIGRTNSLKNQQAIDFIKRNETFSIELGENFRPRWTKDQIKLALDS
jgi:hypothetical protein